jgi:hypothetical protein
MDTAYLTLLLAFPLEVPTGPTQTPSKVPSLYPSTTPTRQPTSKCSECYSVIAGVRPLTDPASGISAHGPTHHDADHNPFDNAKQRSVIRCLDPRLINPRII